MRTFETGATRNMDEAKLDYDGFLSPLALEATAAYMNFHRIQEDGATRDSDNWQKGIPLQSYVKSGWRHFLDWWRGHRGYSTHEGIVFALTGLLFNVQGYLHEYLKAHPEALALALAYNERARRERWARNAKAVNTAQEPMNAAGVGSEGLRRPQRSGVIKDPSPTAASHGATAICGRCGARPWEYHKAGCADVLNGR